MLVRAASVAIVVIALLTVPAAGTPHSTQECSFPYTATDATDTEVTLEEEPDRVVTLNPSAAQTMWEIGARESVVGLTKHATYLEGAGNRTIVSNDQQMVVYETVVNLSPDLVLVPNAGSNETVEQLRNAGITAYYFPPAESIGDVYEKTRQIGRLTGECEGAEETVDWMEDRIGVVREAVDGKERPDVLYYFFGYTAGNDTFIHQIIETAGGNNIAADAGISWYRQLNEEVVIDRNPDWIVLNSNDPGVPASEAYNQTTAVKTNRTVVIPIEHLNQPAPRVVYAIATLAERFHPDAYAEANTTSTPTPEQLEETTSTPTASETRRASTPRSPPPASTETPGQPGFGILAGLVALAIVLVRGRGGRAE